jgi:S-adenosylmethionine:tRNA-ribosyltransferase-isomerase (queuine synthetase)
MNPLDLELLSSWQFELPPELIASRPAETRDGARLLVVDRQKQSITHSRIRDLPELLLNRMICWSSTTRKSCQLVYSAFERQQADAGKDCMSKKFRRDIGIS